MRKVTLVCSVHSPNGKCSVKQLVAILRALGPNVVFQEVRQSDDWSLEAQAVAEYRKFKLCQSVHVDQLTAPTNAVEIKRLLDCGFEYAREISEEYRLLDDENNMRTSQDGFSYLNSGDFEKRQARMSEIEGETIRGKAGEMLQWWRQHMQRREIEMMRNFYAYCKDDANAFDTGVFLIGASHRTGIAKQIENFAGREADLIVWTLYDGEIA